MKYILLFLLISNLGFAQINNPSSVKKYITDETAEKIILHSDRGLYLSGEKIWFNAYCFVPEQKSLNNLSNILYVELYNNSREFITKRKFTISKEKNVYGSIDIPTEFLSGNYYLRAYTQFLKNYPAENYFTSVITIINPLMALPEKNKILSKKDIDIWINKGILISGISSQINFKINTDIIQKLDEVLLVDQENTIISKPMVSENGEGVFEITPHYESIYTIKLMLDNKDSITQLLPEVAKEGMIIKSEFTTNNQLSIEITNQKDSPENQNYRFSILSQNAKTLTEESVALMNKSTKFSFSANILEQGLNYIILKDNQHTIVKAAAIYKPFKAIEIKLATSKQIYAQRELVSLDISVPSSTNKKLTNISVSVVKKGTVNNAKNLIPYLSENSQLLHSFLQDPHNTFALSPKQIDLLMLQYNNVLARGNFNKMFEKNAIDIKWLPEIRDVSISGIVYDKTDKTPIANIPVFVSAFNENPQVHVYNTRKNGGFVFSLNNLVDNQDIYISTKPYQEKEVEIQILNDFSHEFPFFQEIPLAIDTTDQSLLEEMYINMQAGEIFKTKTGSKQLAKISMPFNLGKPDITTILDDYVSSPSLKSIIEEIIPNIRVRRKDDKSILSVFDTEKHIYYEDPLALVDNIPIFNIDDLLNIPPSKINKIEITKKPLIIGDELFNGIVMISTNTDDFGGVKTPEGSVFLEYQTISPSYGFNPPVYDSEEIKSNRMADFRNLLYWNPNLNISKETSVTFYTSDDCSEYDVIVRGYNNDGEICYGKSIIKVIAKQ